LKQQKHNLENYWKRTDTVWLGLIQFASHKMTPNQVKQHARSLTRQRGIRLNCFSSITIVQLLW